MFLHYIFMGLNLVSAAFLKYKQCSRAACKLNKDNQDVDLHYMPIDQYVDMKINRHRFVQYLSSIFYL